MTSAWKASRTVRSLATTPASAVIITTVTSLVALALRCSFLFDALSLRNTARGHCLLTTNSCCPSAQMLIKSILGAPGATQNLLLADSLAGLLLHECSFTGCDKGVAAHLLDWSPVKPGWSCRFCSSPTRLSQNGCVSLSGRCCCYTLSFRSEVEVACCYTAIYTGSQGLLW